MIKTTPRTTKKRSTTLVRSSWTYQRFSRKAIEWVPWWPSFYRYNITVSDEKKFVWFRVAKVGTRTIFDIFDRGGLTLSADSPHGCHYPYSLYKDYFAFGFVRNPWDRLVSCWRNKVVDSKINHFELSEQDLAEVQDFGKFIEYIGRLDLTQGDPHIRLQSTLIDLNRVDFLGRFETFEEDLKLVMQKLNLDHIKVSTKNASTSRKPYQDYYDDALKKRVAEIYHRDIKLFGYKF